MGRKMSKSIGNSPDSLNLITKYGADGVRYGMLSSAAAGNDIIFDAPFLDKKIQKAVADESDKCRQGLGFANKLFNALKLIKAWDISEEPVSPEVAKVNHLAGEWLENAFNQELESLEKSYSQYRLSEGLNNLYNFSWTNGFCSWYLEIIKPEYGKPIDRKTYEQAVGFFEKLMTVLHPFMPFVTEEIWHLLKEREDGDDCVISQYPKAEKYDSELLKSFDALKDIISKTREVRAKNGLKKHEPLKFYVQESDTIKALLSKEGFKETLTKSAVLEFLEFTNETPENGVAFISGTDKFFVIVEKEIDVEAELEKATKEKKRLEGFLIGISKKLGNERFVNNAPAAVVANEKKKQSDTEEKIKQLDELINRLSSN